MQITLINTSKTLRPVIISGMNQISFDAVCDENVCSMVVLHVLYLLDVYCIYNSPCLIH